jgi:DNA topoisomerase-1
VTHNKVNATLPSDIAPDTITLEQAVALIDARAAKGGGKPPRGAKAKAAKEKEAAPAAKASKPAKAAKVSPAKTAKPKKSGAKAAKSAGESGARRKAKVAK